MSATCFDDLFDSGACQAAIAAYARRPPRPPTSRAGSFARLAADFGAASYDVAHMPLRPGSGRPGVAAAGRHLAWAAARDSATSAYEKIDGGFSFQG